MYVTIEQIKKHLNIDPEFENDDQYLQDLIEAAEDAIARHIDCGLQIIADCENGGELPPSLIHAIKLIVGEWYASREPVTYGSVQTIPNTYDYLISLHKVYR